MRWALYAVAVVVLAYGGTCAALYAAMRRPPERFAAVMKHVPLPAMMILPFETMWNRARAGTIAVGAQAPPFTLSTRDRTGTVTLASLRGKPAVLVFGSYT